MFKSSPKNIIFLSLLIFFACVLNSNAQIKEDEVDFEVLDIVTYTKEQSLWKLAGKYYGNPRLWPIIVYENRIYDDKDISINTVLYIPDRDQKIAAAKKDEPIKIDFETLDVITYTHGQTLKKLAEKYYSDPYFWPIIAYENGISNEEDIEIDTLIYIPTKHQKIVTAKKDEPDHIAEIDKLATEKEALSATIEELRAEILHVNEERKAVDEKNKRFSETIEELKAGLLQSNEERKVADIKSEQLAQKLEAMKKDLEEKLMAIDELSGKVAKLQGELIRVNEESNSYKAENEKLRGIIKEQEATIKRIEASLKQLKVASGLVERGFENVSVITEGNSKFITYENRAFRHETRAMREALSIISSVMEEDIDVTLIPQNRGIPITATPITVDKYPPISNTKISDEEFASAIDASLDINPVWRETQKFQKANSSLYKFDLVIHPKLTAYFGQYSDPAKLRLSLAPTLYTNLWKGMSLTAQLILPIYDEISSEGNYWWPGLLTMNQTFRLPANIFASATIGYFTENRYGADLEIREYFANGTLSIGANVGYTGYASYMKGTLQYSDINLLTGFLDAEYCISRFNLTLNATYGKFLYEDMGWQFNVFRQFGETGVSLFALGTDTGKNAGVRLGIPIFPSRYFSPGRVRIRPAKEFSYEYRHKRATNSGIRYETGNSIDAFIKKLY